MYAFMRQQSYMPLQVFKREVNPNMPARTGSLCHSFTFSRFAERVMGGFCIIGSLETGAPILGSVDLIIKQDDYNGLPNDTQFIWFTNFGAWAPDPERGTQAPLMARLQRNFSSRFFAINPDIAHRCFPTSHLPRNFGRYFGADQYGLVHNHAYLRFDTAHIFPYHLCS